VGTTYTRDGAFDIALDGSLANPASGLKVQGWQADAAGKIDITQPITNLVIRSASAPPLSRPRM